MHNMPKSLHQQTQLAELAIVKLCPKQDKASCLCQIVEQPKAANHAISDLLQDHHSQQQQSHLFCVKVHTIQQVRVTTTTSVTDSHVSSSPASNVLLSLFQGFFPRSVLGTSARLDSKPILPFNRLQIALGEVYWAAFVMVSTSTKLRAFSKGYCI